MKDDKAGYEELLVARSSKRYKTVCRRMQHVSKNEK